MSIQTLSKFKESVPSVFDDFFRPFSVRSDDSGPWSRMLNIPAVNIAEDNNEYSVTVAAPGLKKEDIKIDLEGNMLVISSEHEESKEEKSKKFTREEYNYSSFSRSLVLPDEVDKDKIEANYENGVLKISLPRVAKVEKKDAKRIAVK